MYEALSYLILLGVTYGGACMVFFFVLLLSVAELVAGHVTQKHAEPEVVA